MNRAVIAGATGLVGRFLLRKLLQAAKTSEMESLSSNGYRVVAFVRRPIEMQDTALDEVRIDSFDQETLSLANDRIAAAGPWGQTDLFCALGTTIKNAGSPEAFRAIDHDAVLAFARWGKSRGARRFFLVSAMGADVDSRFFYNRVKGEVELDLGAMGFDELHVFRPSLLLGPRPELRPAEKMAELFFSVFGFAFTGPLRPYRPINAETVAEAMVKCSKKRTNDQQSPGRAVLIHSSDEIERIARAPDLEG